MEYTLDAFELIPTVQLASRPIESKWWILKHRNSKKENGSKSHRHACFGYLRCNSFLTLG